MYKIFLILSGLLLYSGCGGYSPKEYAEATIGHATYKDFLETHTRPSSSSCVKIWKKQGINKDYYLSNGNFVHVYPANCKCIIYWEFDKNSQLLVGYRLDGEWCH